MADQNKALRIGAITAAVVGAIAIPATAFAASGYGNGIVERAGAVTGIAGMQTHGRTADFAGPGHRGGPGGAQSDEQLAKLAASLNVSVDALKTALEETRAELQAQKPATPADRKAMAEQHLTILAGKLNVTVDALKAAMEANRPARPEGAGPGQHGPKGDRRGGPEGGQRLESLATALGVTPEALKAAMQAAREETKPTTRPADREAAQAQHDAYIAALAAKLNVSVDQLNAAMEANHPAKPAKPTAAEQRSMLEPRLAAMVTSGKITQDQANQILADLDAGKPVFEVLRQFMPQLGGGEHGPKGPRGNAA